MGAAYPELVPERDAIHQWLASEEESFARTLEQGAAARRGRRRSAKRAGTSWIDADDAFRLHDTYGFPFDLTPRCARRRGWRWTRRASTS